jgi:uncharacterized protein (TIGR03083 family)
VEVDTYIEHLQTEGEVLADTAGAVDPGTRVPTCPEWQVRDLVHHVGGIHRWAATIVRDALVAPPDRPLMEVAGGWPEDADLVGWFRDGHRALRQTLADAEPDLVCWTFLPAPSPRAFWARRQVHETAIHRVDIQSAAGTITPIEPEQAADGIDEFLTGFAARRRPWPWDEPRQLELHAAGSGRKWHVQIGPERVEVVDPTDDWEDDCLVAGPASDLLLLLWNRMSLDELAVLGDAELLASWRELVLVQWSD